VSRWESETGAAAAFHPAVGLLEPCCYNLLLVEVSAEVLLLVALFDLVVEEKILH